MRSRPFSLNFDESTVNGTSQLDINVALLTEELLVERRMLTTIPLQGGTTGKEIASEVLSVLEKNDVDVKNLMSVATDGCGAMIGHMKGAQKYLRDRIPSLINTGGCMAHDLAILLKSSVKCLNS